MTSAAPNPPRSWWSRIFRWIKFLLFAALLLLGLLVVFHRPLLRWAVNQGAPYFAKKAGYQLDWSVTGTVVSDLLVNNLIVKGPEKGPVQKITLRDFKADYSLWELIRKGPSNFLHGLTLADADIEIDSRTPADPKPAEPSKGGATPEFWIDHIDLRNVTARVLTDSGDIVLHGFTLVLDSQKAGEIAIEELIVPSANLHLKNVHGKTEVRDRRIMITDLNVMEGVTLKSLMVGLKDLHDGFLPFAIEVNSGHAKAGSSGSVSELWTKPAVDAALKLTDLSPAEIARWVKLPEGVTWRLNELKLQCKGVPMEPQNLAVDLTAEVFNLQSADVKAESVKAHAFMDKGALRLESLSIHSGLNSVEANATAALPAAWDKMATLSADARWKVKAPSIESIFIKPADFAGSLEGEGTLAIKEGKLGGAEAKVNGKELTVAKKTIKSLEVEVTSDDAQLVRLKNAIVHLDEHNTALVKGALNLTMRQPAKIEWQADIVDLASFAQWAGVKDQPLPDAGKFTAKGKASFNLADVQDKDYTRISADGMARLNGVIWQKATLESVNLDFGLHEGKAEIKQLEVRLNEQNKLVASLSTKLDQTGDFTASLEGVFPQLPDFSGWLELAKAPRLVSGSAALSWKGKGKTSTREITGTGSIHADNVKLEGSTDALSLSLETQHEGHQAEIKKLEARAGKFHANATLAISDTDLSIPRIELFSEDLLLFDGNVQVPLVLAQESRPAIPIDPKRPMQINLRMVDMDIAKLATALGQKPAASGIATLDLDLHGELPDLDGKLSLALTGLSADAMQKKLEPASLKLDATLDQHQLNIEATAHEAPLQPLSAKAQLPLDVEKLMADPKSMMSEPLAATVLLPDSDLATLPQYVPVLASVHGSMGIDVKLAGTLQQPKVEGLIHADVPSADLNKGQMTIRDMKARIAFADQSVTLEDVSATLAGGKVSAGGTVNLAPLTNPTLDLHLEAKEALVMRDETMSLRTNADVTCKGTLSQAEVAGHIDLVRGRVFKEIEFLPLSLPNQLPPPPPVVRRSGAGAALPPPFDKWNYNLDITSRDPIRLLGNILNGGVAVDLHLRGSGPGIPLEGNVSLAGAKLRMPFTTMKIVKGDILFTKDKPLDPTIDLQGDSLINNYQVSVYAYGSALAPKTRFTSSPPLSEQEIATLLATGTTKGDKDSALGVAANRAAFLLVSRLYRELFNKAAPKRFDDEPPKLTFSFSPLATGSSQRGVTATYELSPSLQAIGSVTDRGFRGLFYYLVRFR
jgi:autotransporter translocation and assembly factor TamB